MNDTPTDKDDEIASDISEDVTQHPHEETKELSHGEHDDLEDTQPIAMPATSRTEAIWNNFILAALFANFAVFMAAGGTGNPTFTSNYIGVMHVALIAFICLFRVPHTRFSNKPADWILSIMATWAPLAIFSIGIPSENEVALLFIFNLIGILLATFAIISINKSFGIVPAQREIKTGGLFRVVRHPLYMSYSLCIICIALQTMDPYNIMVTIAVLAAIVLTVKEEETFLSEDPDYVLYQEKVRKKMIPFIW